MARNRTNEEIVDQLVYAVACVARHYGSGLSAEGLASVRKALEAEGPWNCDSGWRVDTMEQDYYGDELQPGFNAGEPNPDFCPSVLTDGFLGLYLADVVRQSRTGVES